MSARWLSTIIGLWFVLVPGWAHAQVGVWQIAGEAHYRAQYEGQTVRGTLPISVETRLDADGHYQATIPSCGGAESPGTMIVGTWSGPSRRFLRAIVSDAIHATVGDCGATGIELRLLGVHQRLAADGRSLDGRFTAMLRYRIPGNDELEHFRVRVRGVYTGTRLGK